MPTTPSVPLQLLTGTSTKWNAITPGGYLGIGEPGYVIDKGQLLIGNGPNTPPTQLGGDAAVLLTGDQDVSGKKTFTDLVGTSEVEVGASGVSTTVSNMYSLLIGPAAGVPVGDNCTFFYFKDVGYDTEGSIRMSFAALGPTTVVDYNGSGQIFSEASSWGTTVYNYTMAGGRTGAYRADRLVLSSALTGSAELNAATLNKPTLSLLDADQSTGVHVSTTGIRAVKPVPYAAGSVFKASGSIGQLAYSEITGTPQTAEAVVANLHTQNSMPTESTRLVDGSDLRLGMPGGVFINGGVSGVAPAPVGVGEFTAVLTVRDVSGANAMSSWLFGLSTSSGGNNDGGRCGVCLVSGVLSFVEVTTGGVATFTSVSVPSSALIGTHYLVLRRSASLLSLEVDGVIVGTKADINPTNAYAYSQLGGDAGYSVLGEVNSYALFNRALTDAECLRVLRGEAPASLANRADGVSYTQGESQTFTNNVGGWLAYGGYGASIAAAGGKLVCTGGSVISWCNQWYNGGVGLQPGEYAATFKARRVSGTVAGLSITTPYDATASIGPTIAEITDTEATYTVRVTLTKATIVGINPVAGSSDGCVYELDDVTIVRLGTVARYEPQNVTSRGRWLDSSGNGYDLLPGTGITPLNPQPVQVRQARFVYNTESTGSWLVALPVGVTASKATTGCLWFSAFPGYMTGGGSNWYDIDLYGDSPLVVDSTTPVTCSRTTGGWNSSYLQLTNAGSRVEGIIAGRIGWRE